MKELKMNVLLRKIASKVINLFYLSGGCFSIWIALQILCFTTFKIPSDSMEPELMSGDGIVVNKLFYGARIFNIFDALNGDDVTIHRMPGFCKIKRNDIIVFNFPYPNSRDSISFDILKYYVKRCVGLPGDTFEIKNAHYKVRGVEELLGNMGYQNQLASAFASGQEKSLYRVVVKGYPHDMIADWSVKEFGPLYIPRKGDRISMNLLNKALYKELIEWEQKEKLRVIDGSFYLGNELIIEYIFCSNYYFVVGDKVMNSQDSRYWGMLPEEYIVGKATRIWNSKDKYTGKIRWERVMKTIE